MTSRTHVVLVLLLDEPDEGLAAPAQLLGRAALEEPVEAEAPVLADLRLELVPGAIPQARDGAQDEAVLLLRVRLALVGAVVDLREGRVARDGRVKGEGRAKRDG
jgi:hypothetical protein